MKKLFLFLLIIRSLAPAFGQQHKVDLGVECGPGLTFLRGNELIEKFNDPRMSVAAGLSLQYNLPKFFSIRTGFLYEQKGSLAKGTILDMNGIKIGSFTARSTFNYLTAPVLIRATFGSNTKFFINSGPYFGYLMKQSFVSEGTNIPVTNVDYTSSYKRLDMGLTLGCGFAIPIKEKLTFSCELRNNLGLYNISNVPVYNDGTTKTNTINLLLGLAYKIGSRHIMKK